MEPTTEDQLKLFKDTAKASCSTNHVSLNWTLYRAARRNREPLPLFRPVDRLGKVLGRQQFLSLEDQRAIREAQGSTAAIAARWDVDPLIIRDLRGPAA